MLPLTDLLKSSLLFLLLVVHPAAAAELTPAGEVQLETGNPLVGGLSGIEITDKGAGFIAISDRGAFVTGTIEREAGQLSNAVITGASRIADSKGQPLGARNTDAEGLALMPDGSLLVSFESNHRIMRHATLVAAGEFLPKHPDFRVLQNNSGLEALAADGSGDVYAIPERSGRLDRPFPLYRFDGLDWEVTGSIPRSGEFLVVGADIGPDGRLYVLERDFRPLLGFAMRIRRYELPQPGVGETLIETGFDWGKNFEGISVWQAPDGSNRLTLISDDNFSVLQQGVIREYVVGD